MLKKDVFYSWSEYYDRVYHWKNYKTDSEFINAVILRYKRSDGNKMLEAACGTGNFIEYFKEQYDVTGIDIDKGMLKIAKKKFPDIKFYQMDMRNFELGKKFDIILCLFSSIAHLKNYSELNKAIKQFSEHLKPGGVVIIEPFVELKDFRNHSNFHDVYKDDNIIISRMSSGNLEGDKAMIDFHFLIGGKGKIKYFAELHSLTMFEPKKFKAIMRSHNIKPYYNKHGLMKRGMYIGVKN